jgi:hypothetical protein
MSEKTVADVDGYPTAYKLAQFAEAIRKKQPKIKFHAKKWSGGRAYELFAYLDSNEYVLGHIGYGDYRIRGDGDPTFMVASRKISNEKVKSAVEQRFMATSINMDLAVKNALKYLIPMSVLEVANNSKGQYTKALRDERDKAVDQASTYIQDCREYSVVKTELINLVRLGVEFVTPAFQKAAANYIAAQNEAEEIRRKKIGAYFVKINDNNKASVLTFDTDYRGMDAMTPTATHEFNTTDLPMDLQCKISVLSMSVDETRVPNVGMKVTERSFWIERDLGSTT